MATAVLATAFIVGACGSTAVTAAPSAIPASPSPSIASGPTRAPSARPLPPGAVVVYDTVTGKAALAKPAADAGAAAGSMINDFALDLLHRLDSTGNVVVSPASIVLALAMVRAGARGTTAAQMDAVLHKFGATGQDAEIVALLKQLRAQTAYVDADGNPLEPTDTPDPANPNPVLLLTIANQLFSQKGMSLEQAYLDSLSSAYGAGAGQLDFKNDPESARLTINKWANDNTKGRIPNVLQPGDVQPATRIALANAIYLKANWFQKFDPKLTAPAPFTTAAGTKVTVPTMTIEMEFQYGAGSGYRMVDVPLDGMSSLSMTFVVPDDMASFIPSLSATKLATLIGSMKTYDVNFWLPKFSTESRLDVATVLASMGMPALFDANTADLSGITSDEKLFIDKVIHQANIDVNEEGVTAAAVTVALGLGGAGVPPPHVDFKVDKPFLYFIRERSSGAILFMGRVSDPSPGS